MAFLAAEGSGFMKTVKLCAKNTRYFNNRWYRNYYVTIPRIFIEKLSLEPGDRLSVEQEDQSIVLTKGHDVPEVESHISKGGFKRIVIRELAQGPRTWSEIRQRTHLPFKRPPPQWIRELQVENRLEIGYDGINHRMLWKIMNSPPKQELIVLNDFGKDERSRIKAE